MKRSSFKQPTYEQALEKKKKAQQRAAKRAAESPQKPRRAMKTKKTTTRTKKKKSPSVRQLKDKLWAECKRITRERHGNICYTCGFQPLEGSNWHTGHGKAKGSLPLQAKFDIRNLRPQCRVCNVYRNGETDIFIAKLEKEPEGLEFLKEFCRQDESGAWRIRKDYPSLSGRESTLFVQELTLKYRGL